jgi:phosphoribosylaminoimidazolecarboxamide formyltransferase / IMP cyclohydrolase
MSPTEVLNPTRALLSVYDKTDIVNFARALISLGIELISSGGTAEVLAEEEIPVTDVADYTGAPEMFSGRVKTLHPRIHGGILAQRPVRTGARLESGRDDTQEMNDNDVPPIDIVCVNLYPFVETVKKPGVTLHEALEKIDIGGPTLIRSAAKNFPSVCVLTDPTQYHELLMAMREYGGIPRKMREAFARAAFHHTAMYDAAIARYFRELPSLDETEDRIKERVFPEFYPVALSKKLDLRYGENPHQQAAYYRLDEDLADYITDSEILQGKEISYNNLLDIDSVIKLCREFGGKICAAVVKHQNPTGVAVDTTAEGAYRKARMVDELAAFGNVTGISGVIDEGAATAIAEAFVEVVVASDFTPEARAILAKKKNLRLVKTNLIFPFESKNQLEIRSLAHGALIQQMDTQLWNDEDFKVVSKRKPTDDEMLAMETGWRVVKHCRSNSTVIATSSGTIGTGSGMTARIDSFRIALEKAGEKSKGAAAATDGFCFPDSIELAFAKGVTAVIEPGGSLQDQRTIEKADELGMALVLTGMRHFRH